MPLKVTLHCGMQITVPVESYQDLIARSIMGSIKIMLSNGHAFHLTKAEIAAAEEIPIAEVNAKIAAQKKAEEDARAASEKAAADAAEEARLGAARDTLGAWNGKPWWKKIGRGIPDDVAAAVKLLHAAAAAPDVETSKAPAPADVPAK